jgi:Uncharacterized conserved protein
MDKKELLKIIRADTGKATGTTETAAVAFLAARTYAELSGEPQFMKLSVSPNVYKGIVSVGVPGTGEVGSDMSLAMGAVIRNYKDLLSVLEKGAKEDVAKAKEFLNRVKIETSICRAAPDMLYFHLESFYKDEVSTATIMSLKSQKTEK